ncbi:MAG: cell division ATP-binding protein FtsE [Bacillota bacterium]
MIKAENLNKVYPNGVTALKNINLEIKQGELVFLMGHSGAGKTTLLKLLMGMERHTSGSLEVCGMPLLSPGKYQIRKLRMQIGAVFQELKLIKGRTSLENVSLALRVLDFPPAGMRERSMQVLEQVGLKDQMHIPVESLSWGQQQRVAIARALVRRPALILADEPTGNLDWVTGEAMMRLFLTAEQEGTTVLVVTHAAGLVEQFGKRVLTLKEGTLL